VRILYARPPTESELRASGLTIEDYQEQVDIWPENWPSFQLFRQLDTQWRISMNGAQTGLVYEAVFGLLDRKKYEDDEWWQKFADIQVMESAALKALSQS
jgi:hypothetical protein